MAQAAVLLPVRLETRFDHADPSELSTASTRLRVAVVPDGCWYDRRQPASDVELDLLDRAVKAAGSPLATGGPLEPRAAGAFEALAAQVGGGRACWLAHSFPATASAEGDWTVERPATPGRTSAHGVRVHALPTRIELHAVLDDELDDHAGPVGPDLPPSIVLGISSPMSFTIGPPAGASTEEEPWWPRWKDLERSGLTFTVDLRDTPVGPLHPDRIAVLYVIGVGDSDAGEVLDAHQAAGDLGLLRAGTATNTVMGTPAGELGRDATTWRALGERGALDDERAVSQAVTGGPDRLGPIVGGETVPVSAAAQVLVPLLWPAIGAQVLRAGWGLLPGAGGELVDRVGRWAGEHLRPDGPLPTLRIGNQPYGLWPVSDWRQWDPSDADETSLEAEAQVSALAGATRTLAMRARTALGNTIGADADRLWAILAQTPTSPRYDVRLVAHLSNLLALLEPDARPLARDWWESRFDEPVRAITGRPRPDGLVAVGDARPLDLGLVLPEIGHDEHSGQPLFLPDPRMPEEVAAEFLAQAPGEWLVAAAHVLAELFGEDGLEREMWGWFNELIDWWPASLLWRLSVVSGFVALDDAHREAALAGPSSYDPSRPLLERILTALPLQGRGEAYETYHRFREAIEGMARLGMEAGTGPLLGDLERNLCGLLDTASHRVDPWLTGAAWRRLQATPGSRVVGLYGWVDKPYRGTPGFVADAGVLLAPSYSQTGVAAVLRDKAMSDPAGVWNLAVSSASAREAVRLGDELRTGAHPGEALGREVERVVSVRAKVDGLRARFPMRHEHAGRRTCDGLAVIEAARTVPADPRLAEAGLNALDITAVAGLQETLDAYADLFVATAAHHALAGRADATAAAVEAAAGLGPPPPLDVLATPHEGRSVRTTVLCVLPAGRDPGEVRSPVAVACPGLATWLDAVSGDPAGGDWTWKVSGRGGASVSLTLLQLGLTPVDVVTIHPGVLDDLALHVAGLGPEATATSPPGPGQARGLATTLAAQPLSGRHLGLEESESSAFDAQSRTELVERLVRLRIAAHGLTERLRAATSDGERRGALIDALGFGLVPDWKDRPGSATEAADALEARLAQSPKPPIGEDVGLTDLAEAVVALVAPKAPLPVLATVRVSRLEQVVGRLNAEPTRASTGRPRLDESWLEVVAAVRPALARLEAHQILATSTDEGAPLHAATNGRGDPWNPRTRRAVSKNRQVPHLVVAYGPLDLAHARNAAIGVLDSWAEVIPATNHTAGAAFRFNAPAARAPQALLLAVPSVPGEEVTLETALAAVAQVRTLAQARMARDEDLGVVDLLSGGVVPAFEPGGLQFARTATHDDWPT